MAGSRIVIMMVGKTRSAFLQEGLAFYAKRLQFYCNLEMITVREEKPQEGLPAAAIMAREGDRLLARLPRPSRVITLESQGQEFTSVELAQWLAHLTQAAGLPLVFIIGGHLGLAPAVSQAADHHLALSRLTFTHEMSRLILLEQLYRAATIQAGHPYHN